MLVLRQTASIFVGLRLFAQRLRLFARLRQMSSPVSFGSSLGFARCLRLSATALHQASPDVFACQLHPFARFRLIARSVIPTWLLRGSSIQSMTEGGVPNSSPSEPQSEFGRGLASTPWVPPVPEAAPFGLGAATVVVEARSMPFCKKYHTPFEELNFRG